MIKTHCDPHSSRHMFKVKKFCCGESRVTNSSSAEKMGMGDMEASIGNTREGDMRRVLKAIWSDEQDREGHFRQVTELWIVVCLGS